MTLILVHAGFHKTGTTSLQDFLTKNGAVLDPCMRYYRRRHMERIAQDTRKFSLFRMTRYWRLRFNLDLARFLRGVSRSDPRPVVLSWEGFSGTIPGFGGVADYSRAVPLARDIVRRLRARFGAGADIRLVYTTRDAAAWRRSAYAHLVKYHPVTDDFDAYVAAIPDAPGFEATLAAIRAAVAPVPVIDTRLEDLSDARFGPASLILDLLDLPAEVRDRLAPTPQMNVSAKPRRTRRFLELNRTGADPDALRRTKMPGFGKGRE